jgi:hypothetical protein
LTAKDWPELAALAKSHHGMPDPDGRVALRIDQKTLPAANKGGEDVSLAALRSPQHLNAIDGSQALSFAAGAVVRKAAASGRSRCIAVPGDASSKVGRLAWPNADFCPGWGRRPAREWSRHRPVRDGLLTLRSWAARASGRSAPE